MKKLADSRFMFITAIIAVVMVAGLFIVDADNSSNKYEAGKSAYSIEIIEEPEPTEEVIELTDDTAVYASPTGSKYHIKNDCGRMNPETAIEYTLKVAEENGLEPCSICLKGA